LIKTFRRLIANSKSLTYIGLRISRRLLVLVFVNGEEKISYPLVNSFWQKTSPVRSWNIFYKKILILHHVRIFFKKMRNFSTQIVRQCESNLFALLCTLATAANHINEM